MAPSVNRSHLAIFALQRPFQGLDDAHGLPEAQVSAAT